MDGSSQKASPLPVGTKLTRDGVTLTVIGDFGEHVSRFVIVRTEKGRFTHIERKDLGEYEIQP